MDAFLVVIPTGKCAAPAVQKWVDSELAHAQARWQDCFRAVLPAKQDTEITKEDIAKYNLVCFGDESANAIIKQAAAKPIEVLSLADLGLGSADVGEAGSLSRVRRMYVPDKGRAQLIAGDTAQQAARLAEIIKEFKGAAT